MTEKSRILSNIGESELLLPGGFPGLVLHWQAAVFGTGGASFGPNRTSVVLQ